MTVRLAVRLTVRLVARLALACCIVTARCAGAAPDNTLFSVAQARQPALLRDLAALVDIDSGTDDAAGLARAPTVPAWPMPRAARC